MKMKDFISGVRRAVSKKGPEILTWLGIAGIVTTVIFAIKGTIKAVPLAEETKEKAEENDTEVKTIEVVKATWKCYIPMTTAGLFTMGCFIGAQSVNAKRMAALATACTLSETALTEFKNATENVVGEEKFKEVKKIAEEKVDKIETIDNGDGSSKVIVASDGDTWFLEPMSNQTFPSTINKIDAVINKLNRDMISEMYISLSQLYVSSD